MNDGHRVSCLWACSIGPVQEFIAAARRTHDLYRGSKLLGRVALRLAQAVQTAGGELIFPPLSGKEHGAAARSAGISNKVLAELPDGVDPAGLADHARVVVREVLQEVATEALAEAERRGLRVDTPLWEAQLVDAIEVYAAWARGADGRERYQQVEALLAGRKALRDFAPWVGPRGRLKSSLDGRRECVISGRPEEELSWLKKGEHLDALGLIKRLGQEHVFPSVSRVAADPYLRTLEATAQGAQFLDKLRQTLGCQEVPRRWPPQYRALADDAAALYWGEDASQDETPGPRRREVRRILEDARKALNGAMPAPYYGVLHADGDRMGQTLAELGTAERQRTAARALADFAAHAHELVAQDHGVAVYAGGDDLLAFVPVDTALSAARHLREAFRREVQDPLAHLLGGALGPSLSVGLAIGHHKDALEDMLERARQAEHLAKERGRDALGIIAYTGGGGGALRLVGAWEDQLDRRLTVYAQLFQSGRLADQTVYALDRLAQTYVGWEVPVPWGALAKEVERVLRRRRPPLAAAEVARLMQGLDSLDTLRGRIQELALARRLAEYSGRAGAQVVIPADGPAAEVG